MEMKEIMRGMEEMKLKADKYERLKELVENGLPKIKESLEDINKALADINPLISDKIVKRSAYGEGPSSEESVKRIYKKILDEDIQIDISFIEKEFPGIQLQTCYNIISRLASMPGIEKRKEGRRSFLFASNRVNVQPNMIAGKDVLRFANKRDEKGSI